VERADAGMIQRRDGTGFAFEALFQIERRRKMAGQDFDGDGPIEARIAGTVHFAHAARAQRRDDFVRAEPVSGGELHIDWLSSVYFIEEVPRTGGAPCSCLVSPGVQ